MTHASDEVMALRRIRSIMLSPRYYTSITILFDKTVNILVEGSSSLTSARYQRQHSPANKKVLFARRLDSLIYLSRFIPFENVCSFPVFGEFCDVLLHLLNAMYLCELFLRLSL